MTTTTRIQPGELPAAVSSYLVAHAAGDTARAVRAFGPTAVVVDQGQTFRGTEEILGFLRHSGSEFSYSIEPTGAQRVDDEHWVAVNHLEGDFPGGVVDLAYRFTMAGDRIAELVIAP